MLDELEKLGLLDNTIVVYTADHGEMMAEHRSWTKGLTGYEATIRVPMIIRDNKVSTGGLAIEKLACSIDLMPTLLDLAGLEIPGNIQGKSLRPSDIERDDWREYAFSEIGRSSENTVLTVRATDQKYVHYRKDGQRVYEQLFDLKEDPWEIQNLAADPGYEDRLEEFRNVLSDWEAETEKTPPMAPVRPR